MNFQNAGTDHLTIKSIKEKTDGIFDVSGCINWIADKVTTTSGNVLREGIILDQTGNMAITFWGDQISNIQEKK